MKKYYELIITFNDNTVKRFTHTSYRKIDYKATKMNVYKTYKNVKSVDIVYRGYSINNTFMVAR